VPKFSTAVHLYFGTLAGRFDLQCTASTDQFVRFQNKKVFLHVIFDAGRSFEIGVEIGQLSTTGLPERPFNLAEILRLQNAPDTGYVEKLQVSESAAQENAISRLAELTEKYAVGLLEGNELDFLRQAKFRDIECAEYALSRDLRRARQDAENAWAKQDYLGVVKAYRPLEAVLTQAEKKRLAYAEKHATHKSTD
jgi:hypothetical protein